MHRVHEILNKSHNSLEHQFYDSWESNNITHHLEQTRVLVVPKNVIRLQDSHQHQTCTVTLSHVNTSALCLALSRHLSLSGHSIHKSWAATRTIESLFIFNAFDYAMRDRQDSRGNAHVSSQGSLGSKGRWFPEGWASHHLGFLVWGRLQCPHCWVSRPHFVFCGLPSSESRVKTETQLKCQVLFCFKCSQGLGRGFAVSPQAFTRAAHFGRTWSPDRSASADPECSWIPGVMKRWDSGGSWRTLTQLWFITMLCSKPSIARGG